MLRNRGMHDDLRADTSEDLAERMRLHGLIVRPMDELESSLKALYREWRLLRATFPRVGGCAN